jgi:hypothetical protein
MCQVEVVFYVETAARRKAYPLDILPASSLIGRVPSENWVTHRIQTSRGLPFRTVAQPQRVSIKVKRSLTYNLGPSSGHSVSDSVSSASGTAKLSPELYTCFVSYCCLCLLVYLFVFLALQPIVVVFFTDP